MESSVLVDLMLRNDSLQVITLLSMSLSRLIYETSFIKNRPNLCLDWSEWSADGIQTVSFFKRRILSQTSESYFLTGWKSFTGNDLLQRGVCLSALIRAIRDYAYLCYSSDSCLNLLIGQLLLFCCLSFADKLSLVLGGSTPAITSLWTRVSFFHH